MKNASGFTLIELVAVIVILGILATTALPKFIDLTKDTRTAAMLTAVGSIKSAAQLVNAKVLTSGTPTDSTVRQVDIGGGNLIDVQNGYPACSPNGIIKASGTSNNFIWFYCCGNTLCTIYPNQGKDSQGNTIYNPTCATVCHPYLFVDSAV